MFFIRTTPVSKAPIRKPNPSAGKTSGFSLLFPFLYVRPILDYGHFAVGLQIELGNDAALEDCLSD